MQLWFEDILAVHVVFTLIRNLTRVVTSHRRHWINSWPDWPPLEKEWWSKDVKYDKIRGEVWWQWKTVISHAKRMQTWNSLLIKSIHREYLEDISKILLYTEFPICSIQVMDPFISTTKSDRQRTCELVCLMSPQGGQLMTASSAFNSLRQQSKCRIWKIL